MNKAKRLEFHITNICNQSCIFCSEADRMKKYEKFPISFLQIKIILIEKRKKGFEHITFLGGEPTLYPNFLELLKFSKKLGYKIMVITNGFGFINKEKCFLFNRYIDEISLSIHGYNDNTLGLQTNNKLSYKNLKKIISNFNDYNKKFNNKIQYFSNIVINTYNINFILKIIDFIVISGYPLKQLLISYIAPEGQALKNYKNLSFHFDILKKYIENIIYLGKQNNIKIVFFGVPICILGEKNYIYSNDVYFSEKNTIERFTTSKGKITLVDIYSPDSSRERKFVDKCFNCKYKKNPCTGVFNEYLKYYDF